MRFGLRVTYPRPLVLNLVFDFYSVFLSQMNENGNEIEDVERTEVMVKENIGDGHGNINRENQRVGVNVDFDKLWTELSAQGWGRKLVLDMDVNLNRNSKMYKYYKMGINWDTAVRGMDYFVGELDLVNYCLYQSAMEAQRYRRNIVYLPLFISLLLFTCLL